LADTPHLGSDVGLTVRESDVLRLITLGLSNQEIAHTLFLTTNSVKTYIRSTYRKMRVGNRAEAVAWAIQHGFPPPGP
jgi:DNA-binding NarL/FixJ family response regulator